MNNNHHVIKWMGEQYWNAWDLLNFLSLKPEFGGSSKSKESNRAAVRQDIRRIENQIDKEVERAKPKSSPC